MLSANSRIQKQFRNLLETAGIHFKEKIIMVLVEKDLAKIIDH
jgi:hypothetical protein